MTKRSLPASRALALVVALVAAQSALAQQRPAPAGGELTFSPPRPGSREDARQRPRLKTVTGVAFVKSASGLWVPDRRIMVATPEQARDEARWRAMRRGVIRHLKARGAELAPLPYQRVVEKIRRRAQLAMAKTGMSLASWKLFALQGGIADQVNATTWSGGLITVYRPLIDLCFQISAVIVNTHGPREIDAELWRLSRWRKSKGALPVPESLAVKPADAARRDVIAESLLASVVLHELGHAASGHVALEDRKLIVPGRHEPLDAAASRDRERKADAFAIKLAGAGAVRAPGVMPLFSYYHFIERPSFKERGKLDVVDWRTHPLDAERFNNQPAGLKEIKRSTKGLPEPLAPRIVLPSGGFATPLAPSAPPAAAPAVQEPLRKAALQ
jgi:Zn-dependent protease with chaperone function